jgi:hypothetical protein
MTTTQLTALLASMEFRAQRDGAGRVGVIRNESFLGGHRATRESLTHKYSLPVVREMPPRSIRSIATW